MLAQQNLHFNILTLMEIPIICSLEISSLEFIVPGNNINSFRTCLKAVKYIVTEKIGDKPTESLH